jgi:hypothetical protein
MPMVRFTGFGRTAPAVRGRFALWGLFEQFGPANCNVSESIAGGKKFTAANHELMLLIFAT